MKRQKKLGIVSAPSVMITLTAIIIILRKDLVPEPEQGEEPFSHAFLGRARHSDHVKTEGTKNIAKCPLPQWPSQRTRGETARCRMGPERRGSPVLNLSTGFNSLL